MTTTYFEERLNRTLRRITEDPDVSQGLAQDAIHIRWMIRHDMPEVLQMAWNSNVTVQEEDLLRMLAQRNVIGMVAEVDEAVLGWMIYGLSKDHLKLEYLVTGGNEHTRDAIGGKMIEKLKAKLSPQRRSVLIYDVPQSDLDSKGGRHTLELLGNNGLLVMHQSDDGIIMAYPGSQTSWPVVDEYVQKKSEEAAGRQPIEPQFQPEPEPEMDWGSGWDPGDEGGGLAEPDPESESWSDFDIGDDPKSEDWDDFELGEPSDTDLNIDWD